jgi:hypothetical protein
LKHEERKVIFGKPGNRTKGGAFGEYSDGSTAAITAKEQVMPQKVNPGIDVSRISLKKAAKADGGQA